MKLDVGIYVRTKDGHIDKIIDTAEEWYELDGDEEEKPYKIYKLNKYYYDEEFDEETKWFLERFFVKASYNIIDLIEDDDIAIIEYYVSKYRQRINRRFECSLFKSKEDDFVIFENKHCDWWYDKNKKEWVRAKGYNPKIKSILTKESFSQMEYKID